MVSTPISAVFDPGALTPTLIITVLGAALLAIGVTGGGIEWKGLRVPAISTPWRVTSLLLGVALLLTPGISRLMPADSLRTQTANPSPQPPLVPAGKETKQPDSPAPSEAVSPVVSAGEKAAKPTIAARPHPVECPLNMNALVQRAKGPPSPYTWHEYNNDLEDLEVIAIALIDTIKATPSPSPAGARLCLDRLSNAEREIQTTTCTNLVPDNDPYDHCHKNFDLYAAWLGKVRGKLEGDSFKAEDVDLGQERSGFSRWFNESVVSDGKGRL